VKTLTPYTERLLEPMHRERIEHALGLRYERCFLIEDYGPVWVLGLYKHRNGRPYIGDDGDRVTEAVEIPAPFPLPQP
jgi:hypothetical protein